MGVAFGFGVSEWVTVCTEYIFGLSLAGPGSSRVITVPETVCILAQWNHSKPNIRSIEEVEVTKVNRIVEIEIVLYCRCPSGERKEAREKRRKKR